MTVLNLIYCLVGGVFIVLGAACLWEKYRTVRGGVRLPARVIECRRQGRRIPSAAGTAWLWNLPTPPASAIRLPPTIRSGLTKAAAWAM